MPEKQKKLITLLTNLMPKETTLATSVKGLTLFRIEDSFTRTPYAYNSEIIILGQGEKRTYLGSQVFTYDPSHYLVLPVPMPLECEGMAKPGKPILGLSIAIDPMEVGEILLNMEDTLKESHSLPKGIYGAPMSAELLDATLRLLLALKDPQDKKVLAPLIKREIIYPGSCRAKRARFSRLWSTATSVFFRSPRYCKKYTNPAVLISILKSWPGIWT